MTVIYLAEYNTRCHGVTFQNIGCVKVQKFEDISVDENNIISARSSEIFLGKREICNMTCISGAFDKSVFDGSTILLEKSEENGKDRYVYIGGDGICSFLSYDYIYEHISNTGLILTRYSIAVGHENIYF